MITIRKAIDRGHATHGWLDTHHTFSFANYYHPDHMSYRALRVINEDRIAPAAGFPPHSHEDMEIITYVIDGAVAHKDSTGGGGVIRPGEVQYMCAGTGVTHSEFNASEEHPLHLYQIWILPDARGHKPRYEQKDFSAARNGRFALAVSPDGRDGSIAINQDASLHIGRFADGAEVRLPLDSDRRGWLQVASGGVEIGGAMMQPGDGARIENEAAPAIKALAETELLFFNLA